jgi:hypothetical protein
VFLCILNKNTPSQALTQHFFKSLHRQTGEQVFAPLKIILKGTAQQRLAEAARAAEKNILTAAVSL